MNIFLPITIQIYHIPDTYTCTVVPTYLPTNINIGCLENKYVGYIGEMWIGRYMINNFFS